MQKLNKYLLAAGNLANAMVTLEFYGQLHYWGISYHDVQQYFTWASQVAEGQELSAWGTDTDGIIAKMEDGTARLQPVIEKQKELHKRLYERAKEVKRARNLKANCWNVALMLSLYSHLDPDGREIFELLLKEAKSEH